MWQIGQALIALDYKGCLLRWPPSLSDDLDGYHVYMRAGTTGAFNRMTGTPIIETQWFSPELRLDTKYYFYITASDTADNESTPSATIPFQLKDARVEENIIYVPSPVGITLEPGLELLLPISEFGTNIYTKFELGEIV